MDRQAYYGHESQLFGVEEHRLVGGRGDGMRLLQVRNGLGLEFTVSADRGCDISRLSWKGDNYGFFSANGYVGPAYYDDRDAGWMKGFTAGLSGGAFFCGKAAGAARKKPPPPKSRIPGVLAGGQPDAAAVAAGPGDRGKPKQLCYILVVGFVWGDGVGYRQRTGKPSAACPAAEQEVSR